MERTFTISTFSKILNGAGATGLAAFGIFLISKLSSSSSLAGGIILSMLLFLGAAALILYILRREVTVSDNMIKVQGMFTAREIALDDAKGFSKNDKAVYIHYKEEGRRRIMINDFSAIGKSDDLLVWLSTHITDLDLQQFQDEQAVLLKDTELGSTEEKRMKKLKAASRFSLFYFGLSFILPIVYYVFDPSPLIVASLYVLFVLTGVLAVALSNGLIRIYAGNNSAYSSLFFSFFVGSGGVLLFSKYHHFVRFSDIWKPVATVAFTLLLMLIFITLKQTNHTLKKQLIAILFVAATCGFAVSMEANIGFDRSNGTAYRVVVKSKYKTSGKNTIYHLVVSPWDLKPDGDDVMVPSSLYDEVSVDSRVQINLKQGALGVPWYHVSR